jgi:hypothetical protein
MRRASRTISCCLLLAAAASPASADPWELTNDRILGDPSFLPLAGEVEGYFQYSYEARTYHSNDGFPPESADQSFNTFTPFLSYGVTDRLSAGVQLPFGNERINGSFTTTEFVPNTNAGFFNFGSFVTVRQRFSERSVGAADPTFQLAWRAIEQGSSPVNLDLMAFYLPNIFQARTSVGQTGSIASGGQSGGFEAAASREMEALTVRAYAELTLVGPQHLHAEPQVQSVYYGGREVYAVGLQSETRVVPWLAVNAGVEAAISTNFDQTSGTRNGPGVRVIEGGQIDPYVGLVIPLLGGRAAGEFLYQHDFIGDQKDRGPAGSTKFYGQSGNIYLARLLFRFQAL